MILKNILTSIFDVEKSIFSKLQTLTPPLKHKWLIALRGAAGKSYCFYGIKALFEPKKIDFFKITKVNAVTYV